VATSKQGRALGILIAVPVAALAWSMARGALAPVLTFVGALVLGAVFGVIAGLGQLAGRHDWRDRIGTLVILFVGGVAVFAPADVARSFVPGLSVGGIVGFVGLVLALAASPGGEE